MFEKLLWLQNYFLENRFLSKFSSNFFWSKIFYGCKFISSETGLIKNFINNFLVEKFLWLQNHFRGNRFEPEIFYKKVLVENFCLHNQFLGNWIETRNILLNFLKNFLWLQIISSVRGSNQEFPQKTFGRKFFMVAKSFPRK